MKLVLTGAKSSGKSALGSLLAEKNNIPFYETDTLIEGLFLEKHKIALPCRAICSEYGEDYFREIERECVSKASSLDNCIISTGGSTLLNRTSRQILSDNSLLILFKVSVDKLIERLKSKNIPAYLLDKTALELFAARASMVNELIGPFADIVIDSSLLNIDTTYNEALNKIYAYFFKKKDNLFENVKFLGKTSDTKYAFAFTGKLDTEVFRESIKKTFSVNLEILRPHQFLIELQISSENIKALLNANIITEKIIEKEQEVFIISKLLSKFLISGKFSGYSNSMSLLKFILF